MVKFRSRKKCSKMKMLSADEAKNSSGVFTCQNCNSIFTCLEYYQQHRKDHALEEKVKLLTCHHCPYVSDNNFHFNWHIMTHAGQDPHKCGICAPNQNDDEIVNDSSDYNISECIIEDGKRSIATQSDDLYPDSPPPPYHQHNNSLSSKSTTIYDNLDTIDSRGLLDNDDNNQNESEETEEDEQDEEGEGEEEYEEEDNQNEQQSYQEGSEHQQTNYFQSQPDDDATEEEEVEEEEDDDEEEEGYQYESYEEQQMSQNAEYQEGGDENEGDDGTVEDEEPPNLIMQEENAEYGQNQEFIQQENCGIMMDQSFQEDDDDFDDQGYEDALEDDVENEEEEGEGELTKRSSDVYDFNSDDDVLGGGDHTLSSSLGPVSMPQSISMNATNPHQSTIQLQPTFVHQQPHPHAPQPHHSHNHHPQQQQQQQPGLTNLQPHSHMHQQPQGPAQGDIGAQSAVTLQNASFQLPAHLAANSHHSQAHHFIAINGPNNAFVAAPQQGANSFQFDPNAFTNGQIRLVSIPASFNPQQQQAAQLQPQQMHQVAQPHLLSQQQQIQQPEESPIHQTPTTKPKKIKKTSTSIGDAISNGTVKSEMPDCVTPVQPPYVPTKGKGKGNRKPRINFITVINGITVGADGIRRKFHCSHCGNGKSFKTKSHLQRHMLTHTGEKPYQCQECGSKFNQSSSLRNHLIAIHTKHFPHKCATCGKGFLMPAVLQKHLQQTGHVAAKKEASTSGEMGGNVDGEVSNVSASGDFHNGLMDFNNGDNNLKEDDEHKFLLTHNS